MKRCLSLIAAVVAASLCVAARADRYDWQVPADGQGVVLLVRNSRTLPSQEQAHEVAACFDRVRSLLDVAGLPLRVVDDKDVGPEVLSAASLVVLPYNPQPAPSLAVHLPTYVLKGGKIIDLGGGGETQRHLGLDELALRKARRDGEFASIVFDEEAGAGLPDVANPATAIHIVDMTAPGVRVLARWASSEGRRLPYAAVVETPRGIYVAGTLTDDDREQKIELLLRLAARLCPPMGKRATEQLLQRVHVRSGDRPDWQAVARLAAEARTMLADDPLAANAVARKAVAACELATAADMPTRDGELRLAWVPDPLIGEPIDWDRLAEHLAGAGFAAMVVEVGSPSYTIYPSRIFRADDRLAKRGDQLGPALKAAHAHGLKLYAMRHAFFAAGDEDDFVAQQLATMRLSQEDDKKASIAWLCPNRGDAVDREIAAVEELLSLYDVDGFVRTSAAFAGAKACTCRECRAAVEQRLGKNIENWPEDLYRDGPPRKHWLAMRRETAAAVMGRVAAVVRRVRPKAKLALAVDAAEATDADLCGLDWSAWAAAKNLDLVLISERDVPDDELAGVVTDQVSRAAGRVPLVPILAPAETSILNWEAVAGRIGAARSAGAAGYGLWPLADRSGRLLELLRVGPNRPAEKPQTQDGPKEP